MKAFFLLSRAGAAALALAVLPALAGPGAHGPGGEHLDAPAATAAAGGAPRVEASSETFELVGQLYEGELSLLIDRYESNEPVLGAQVEVESGGLKAIARFHADHGDYAVDDAPLLALLRQPGEHALVFTIVLGEESDLLDGTLAHGGSAGPDDAHGTDGTRTLWGLALLLVAGGAAGGWWWRRRAAGTWKPGARA